MGFAGYYLNRYADNQTLIEVSPDDGLNLIVTIPCFDEDKTVEALESLYQCTKPKHPVEVIILVNYPDNTSPDIASKHNRIFNELQQWSKSHSSPQLRFFPILQALPAKTAGVGHARKVAMDEAVRRFDAIDKPFGIIAGFDADCTCDSNYLKNIGEYFNNNPEIVGCSIYFEHPLEGNQFSKEVYESILLYELYLRYYIEGFRFAGFPNAYHTIGSSFAVTAKAYVSQGGMNKRKAGEDFYFLQKIMQFGPFGELNSTCVRPSPRPSQRVPFGTGAAIAKMLDVYDTIYPTFDPASFTELKNLFIVIDTFFKCSTDYLSTAKKMLSLTLLEFPVLNEFEQAIAEINANANTPETFRKRFFQWFDGLKCLQFLNFVHENHYQRMDIVNAATKLAAMHFNVSLPCNASALLDFYRKIQRETEAK